MSAEGSGHSRAFRASLTPRPKHTARREFLSGLPGRPFLVRMRTLVCVVLWIFAEVEPLVLQPGLTESSAQNVSLEARTWTDHLQEPPAGGGRELNWEKEPGTHISVTVKEEDEADDVHGQNVERSEEQRESKEEAQGHPGGQEDKTRNEEQEVQGGNRDVAPSADASLATLNSPQVPASIAVPSLISTPTQRPAVLTHGAAHQHAPAVTGASMRSASESGAHENSSLGRMKSSEKDPGAAAEARAGPAASSLPSTFKPKAKAKASKMKSRRFTSPTKNKEKQKETRLKPKNDPPTSAPYFPYFGDHYCPPDCACYGRVVQCSDKGLEKLPYGIPFNSRYVLLMNNRISSVPLALLAEYRSMEFLVLSNNRLVDRSIEGSFEGIPALKRLYLDRNLLQSVPADLPASLEELLLDGNNVTAMSEVAWSRCPGLHILSLSNNSVESTSSSFPVGVLSPLASLRTLGLSYNRLTSVPLRLPLSLQDLYLRGNLIQRFQGGVFQGKAQLQVLDLSANRLTNKGLGKDAFVNVTRLESLNLEGNLLKHVPRYLPRSLKTLNLERNSISGVGKTTFLSLPCLEHLGLARNKISKVVPGAFRALPLLHQLDLSHNALEQVPRQLPAWLLHVALNRNKIRAVPRDAFCSRTKTHAAKSRLVKVQLEDNLVDVGGLDGAAFRWCIFTEGKGI